MTTVLIFIAVLAVLVLVHELGHFTVAKWSGMRVDEFGFGFPPRLFAFKYKDTEYSVNIIPLGGFVRIHGENGEGKTDQDSFAAAKWWKRFATLIAGVVMNLLLAWVIYTVGFIGGIPTVIDNGVDLNGARVTDERVQVLYVLPDSPAEEAGLTREDRIVTVDGVAAATGERARDLLGQVPAGQEAELVVERAGESRTVMVTPEEIEEGMVAIGVQIETVADIRYAPHTAIVQGAVATANMTYLTAEGFITVVGGLIRGDGTAEQLSGPIGIAVITGEVAQQGFMALLSFAAILSINLAILNVLPFPALDGGRILFLVIEAIRRKPVTEKVERTVHGLGFILLMILVVLVTYKDILGLIRR